MVYARQSKRDQTWFVGALTDEQPRQLKLSLDFLTPGKSYRAEIYRDGEQAHWLTNPYALQLEQQTVTAQSELNIQLAASGGLAIRFVAMP